MTGEELTHWTIRLSLVCLVVALALAAGRWQPARFRWYRLFWTAGLLLFLLHVTCAFHFFYHWSHSFAVEQTALKTRQLIGISFGRGIWFSYLFALVWLADASWAWLAPRPYQLRSRLMGTLILGYLCFIAFQGAVVFERGWVQPLGLVATVGLALWVGWQAIQSRRPPMQANASTQHMES